MHELGVTFHVLDSVEEIAIENKVSKVNRVVVELGEVSTVIDEYLQKCWKWSIQRRPLFTDCLLQIEKIPAITFCTACEQTYNTVEYGKICPHCGSVETYLVQGNEFKIKEIEVE